uniref:Uncharacterized protein n=1 Tax=Timema tahoe TaxID=61484 RepID=A0A7R9IL87_9NEOP|nr:unnamed protein product [Timema tahoe]
MIYKGGYEDAIEKEEDIEESILKYETICPSSVAAYFESRGHCVSVCHPKFLQRHDYNVSVPVISPTDERECCTPSELIEWLGAYSVGADLQSGEPDNFVNTYQPPVESILLGKVVYLQWTGFFTYLRIQKLFAAIRQPPRPIGFGDVSGADEVSVGCSKSSACGDPSPKGRLSNHSGSRDMYGSERRWD